MKFIKKSIKLLVVSVLICSFVIAGCDCSSSDNKDTNNSNNENKQSLYNNQSDQSNTNYYLNPSHEEIVETSGFIIKNGQCNYKIVIPSDADTDEISASEKLHDLFKEATGCVLPIKRDTEISSINSESQYILIGDNNFAKDENLVPTQAEVTYTGYIITTKDNCIYIAGCSGVGTLFGVQRFLGYILDYDYFAENIYSLNKNVTDIPLSNYNVKIVPDCEYNQLSYYFLTEAESKNFSMYTPKTAPVGGRTGHNSIYFTLNNEEDDDILKAMKNHPKWFMDGIDISNISEEDAAVNTSVIDGVSQLCYTAHGDSEELEKLCDRMAESIEDRMISDPTAFKFSCSVMDNHTHCKCEWCNAENEKYGTPAGSMVKTLNKVAEKVDAWMKTDEGKPYAREWFMTFIAYNDYQNAPIRYISETDSYELIDEDVKCNEHVIPQVAYVGADYTSPVEATQNTAFRIQYLGWRNLSKKVISYFYEQQYNYYLVPYNVFGVLSNQYKFLKGDYVYMLCANNDMFATGFGNLKIYLSAKLGIDVNANVEELIVKYFKNVYKDAGDTMYNLFNEYRVNEQRLKEKYPMVFCSSKSCYNNAFVKSTYYEATLFDKWRADIEKALSQIDYLKTQDIKLYNKIYKMTVGERVWVNNFYWLTYHDMMSYDTLESVTNDLIHDIEYCGIAYTREGPQVTTGEFISELKLKLEGAK